MSLLASLYHFINIHNARTHTLPMLLCLFRQVHTNFTDNNNSNITSKIICLTFAIAVQNNQLKTSTSWSLWIHFHFHLTKCSAQCFRNICCFAPIYLSWLAASKKQIKIIITTGLLLKLCNPCQLSNSYISSLAFLKFI